MSDSEAEEDAAPPQPRRPVRRAPRGGDPHLQQKLSVLSGTPKLPKWSFGTESRFKQSESLNKSQSSPALVSTLSDGGSPPASPGAQLQPTWDATLALERSIKAPRLDGALDRAIEQRQRNGQLRAKHYQPAETIGEATASTYAHAPRFSFGGGKSRASDQERRQQEMLKQASASAQEKIKQLAKTQPPPKKKVQLNRGFGGEVRLRHKGSAFDLPVSPGPAAYELARDSDLVPEWSPSALVPYGVRTAERPAMVNPTATDVAPGHHTAHHTMKASRPSPLFGHPLRSLTRDNFPDPGAYPQKSYMAAGPSFSVGPGQRTKWNTSISPGPAYDPNHDSVDPHSFASNFGSMERAHPSDEIDADEPPGPGAHKVQREWTLQGKASDPRAAGFGFGERQQTGVASVHASPGPCYAIEHKDRGLSVGIHLPLPRPIEQKPGAGHYDPDDTVWRHRHPGGATMSCTDARKSPFVPSSGTEKASELMLRRCALEVAQENEKKGIGGKREDKIAFVPKGPSFTLGARRHLNVPGTDGDCEASVGGPTSGFG